MYELTCGACGETTVVESDIPVTEWACEYCPAESITSLPTTEDGDLI